MPTVADWSGIGFATVGALLVSVSLTLTAVPTVQERPELSQILTVLLAVLASAKAKEEVPTTKPKTRWDLHWWGGENRLVRCRLVHPLVLAAWSGIVA